MSCSSSRRGPSTSGGGDIAMKLATVNDGTRDGRLVVVTRDLSGCAPAAHIARTLREAIENWPAAEAPLRALSDRINSGGIAVETFDANIAMAPLPRAFQWCDGSAFLHHGRLMAQALKLDPSRHPSTIPLMYQGSADHFIAPREDIRLPDEAHAIDFEGEFAVVVDDVPLGCRAADAARHIKLVMLVNDVSLRAFASREMNTGFGFLHAKPASGFAPVAVTPDELGAAWRDERVHLPLSIHWNDTEFGHPHGGEMNFSFAELIAHAAFTRRLCAGTIIGSGTVSNVDRAAGSACIMERRAIETIEYGQARTGFMRFGDRIRMEAFDATGQSVFGAIDQRIVCSAHA